MSPGTGTAAQPRLKPATSWYSPAESVPLRAGVPKATRQYWPIVTRTQKDFLLALEDPQWSRQNKDLSWTSNPPGYTKLAELLGCDRKTIYRLFIECAEKRLLKKDFDYIQGTRKIHSTKVKIFSYSDALRFRQEDPDMAKTVDRRVLYRGRGRRPMSPTEAANDWHIQLDHVPETDEPEPGESFEKFAEAPAANEPPPVAPQPAPAPPPPPPVEMPLPAADDPREREIELILDTLRQLKIPGVRHEDAVFLYRAVRKISKAMPVQEIADSAIACYLQKKNSRGRNPGAAISVGLLTQMVEGDAHTWNARQSVAKKQAQAEAPAPVFTPEELAELAEHEARQALLYGGKKGAG